MLILLGLPDNMNIRLISIAEELTPYGGTFVPSLLPTIVPTGRQVPRLPHLPQMMRS